MNSSSLAAAQTRTSQFSERGRQGTLERATLICLKGFCLLGPIYWLPGVPVAFISFPKEFLLAGWILFGGLLLASDGRFRLADFWPAGSMLLLVGNLLMLPGVLLSVRFSVSLAQWCRPALTLFAFLILLRLIRSEERLEPIFKCLLLAQFCSVLFLIINVVIQESGAALPWSSVFDRVTVGDFGLSYRRTAFSHSSALVLPTALWLGWQKKGFRPIWMGVAMALLLSTYLSSGRGGTVGAVLVLGVILAVKMPKIAFVGIAALVLGVILDPGLPIRSLASLHSRTIQEISANDLDEASSGRLASALLAIEIASRHPLTGIGLGNFDFLNDDVRVELTPLGRDSDVSGAHNVILKVASEGGIPAAIAFSLFFLLAGYHFLALILGGGNRMVLLLCAPVLAASVPVAGFTDGILWEFPEAISFWLALACLINARQGRFAGSRFLLISSTHDSRSPTSKVDCGNPGPLP